MADPRSPLSLRVLHPCTRSWDSLAPVAGDRTRRFCDDCNLQVHNASDLSEAQARDLMSQPQRVCMSGFAKSDGLLLTRERLREEARVHLRHRPLLRIAAALGLISIPTALAACNRPHTGGDVNARPMGGRVMPSSELQSVAGTPMPVRPDPPRPVYPGEMSRPIPTPAPPPPPAPALNDPPEPD